MTLSPLLDLHRSAGAQFAQGDPPLLLSFGEVPEEYARATQESLLFDRCDRGLIAVGGRDRADFLHGLLSNRVAGLAEGEGNRTLLLSPKGRVRFDADLAVEAERICLSTPPGVQAELLSALEDYHFSEAVALADVSAQHAPLDLCGPRAGKTVEAVLGTLPAEEDRRTRTVPWRGATVALTPLVVAGSRGLRLDAGPEHCAALWRALREAGAGAGGRIVYDILRVEAGAGEAGVDIDAGVYPQEARIEEAFRLDKGCFVGQEVVAKIDTYGGLNKRLTCLRLSHDDPVPRGTRLLHEESGELRDLGVVTSWAYSFVLDTGLVLAFVKRRHQAPGTRFRLEGHSGEAEVVPMPVREGAVPPGGALA